MSQNRLEVARIERVEARFAVIDQVSRAAGTAATDAPVAASPVEDAAMDTYLDAIDTAVARRGAAGGADRCSPACTTRWSCSTPTG
ncbi:hypothetical protein [Streptomyces sp. CA-111067]|uniref:hypothetical protein n=1 Tax=Streptomyces sp. CA-111067 TaxID=3240046 RepID=UPI003D97BF3A